MAFDDSFRGAILAAAFGLATPTAAVADGEYYSFEFSERASNAVVSATRGSLTLGADYTDFGDGRTAGASVTGRLPFDLGVPGLELSVGPSVRFDDGGDTRFGVTFTAQRYVPTDFGNLFFQAGVNSIDQSYFTQAQVGLAELRLVLALARGASTEYAETTFSLSKRLGDSPFSLRAGYRFVEEELFVGFEVNTF